MLQDEVRVACLLKCELNGFRFVYAATQKIHAVQIEERERVPCSQQAFVSNSIAAASLKGFGQNLGWRVFRSCIRWADWHRECMSDFAPNRLFHLFWRRLSEMRFGEEEVTVVELGL